MHAQQELYALILPSHKVNSNKHLITERHALQLLMKLLPIICLHLRVLYALLRPVLVPAAHMILRLLEEDELITDALLDKYSSSMLSHNRFLVLSFFLASFQYTGVQTYPDNSLSNLLNFARLHKAFWLCPNGNKLSLIVLDSAFKVRDIVLVVPIASVEHISHTDQSITLPLQVL